MYVTVHFEIYLVDNQGLTQQVWRRSEYEMLAPIPGVPYAFYSRGGGNEKWFFPSASGGMHYDTMLEGYVVWDRVSQPADFEKFGFHELQRERWK